MARFRSLRRNSAAALIFVALPALAAVEVPAGTALQIRLKTKVSTAASRPKDTVEAVVISPVVLNGNILVPSGATVRGTVVAVTPSPDAQHRAVLSLEFTQLEAGGAKGKLAAKVMEVDNARESVDDKGQILGILSSQTISGQIDSGIGKVAQRYEGLAGVLGAAKSAVLKEAANDITYDPGVEMTLTLTAPLKLDKVPEPGPAAKLEPVADEAELVDVVVKQPFQTMAERPSKPSDITNLMFIGTEEALTKAFQAAGWSPAASLTTQSKLETFRAVAELRGYKEAPVSVLLLEGRPPDLVFEKQNNTFAQRHHLRIWKRPASFHDMPVWVCAATHDIGIDFSEENRTFIHKIDPQIDRERAKVVNDLLLTGLVKSLALVERPAVPTSGENATGDKLETDGRMAVLILR